MKNETKAIITISSILLISLLLNAYLLRPVPSDGSRYAELYSSARETIGALQDANNLLRSDITELGNIQEQFNILQSKYNDLNRERTEEIRRRAALEETARIINTKMGDEISRGYESIDNFWRELEEVGEAD